MEIRIKWKNQNDQSVLYRRATNTDNTDSVPLTKKRKEVKELAKTQKAAAIANEMARQIFQGTE